jgi:hypothetical protein
MAKTPTSETTASDHLAALDSRIAELDERLTTAANTPVIDTVLIQQQNERILELQRLVGNLGERVAAVQAVNARDAQFTAAVQSVDAAAHAVQRSLSTTAASPAVGQLDTGHRDIPGEKTDHGCHDGPCGCVSCDCCTFEVWMTHVRVDHMQPIEPGDTNALPINELEVWMFASIDPLHNIGVCIPDPGPSSYLPLHKQMNDPYGQWTSVNRCVGTATVRKGAPLVVPLTLTGVEREPDRLPLDRDEWGAATENLTLDCCYSTYSPILIPVALTAWGQGGGAITGKFMVVKKC